MNEFTDEQLAILGHEIVRALKRVNGETDPGAFEDAPEWMQDDSRGRVTAIRNGHSTDPRAEHERWVQSKRDKGYVYGPVRNDDPAKGQLTHPLIVDYDDLSVIDQLKDELPSLVTKYLL